MELSPLHIVGLSLPTLTLLYALAVPAIGGPRVHREVYGNGTTQFEARFFTNPDGPWLPKDHGGVKFAGFWQDHNRRMKVHGVRYLHRGNPSYRFAGTEGEGHGEIHQGKRGCPGELHFFWRAVGERERESVLPSGPCYW